MKYKKVIQLQTLDDNEQWIPFKQCVHCNVNQTSAKEYLGSRAEQSEVTMNFTMRYAKALKAIRLDTQSYRIIYENEIYDIQAYDDYQEQHKEIKLIARCIGISYG